MTKERIFIHFNKLFSSLTSSSATKSDGISISLEESICSSMAMLKKCSDDGGRVFALGNGGSAAIASHMAEDYTKNGGIPMMAFNDAAMITCFANDLGYEKIFEAAINYYAERMDLVIAISSSGKSPNILNGVAAAKAKGCNVITFSGFKPDNPLRKMGDLNFYVPDESYGNVEITHLSLLHAILDFICEDKK